MKPALHPSRRAQRQAEQRKGKPLLVATKNIVEGISVGLGIAQEECWWLD
jgi:hypothetical protein